MTEPVEALLFDLGNVILDIDFKRTTARWAEYAGCDAKTLWKRYRPGDPSHRQHERGEIDDAGYFAALRTILEIDLTDEQFLDGWNATFGGPIAGVEDWIAPACSAVPAYVFSNTNPAHELYFRANYDDLLRPFRTVFTSSGIGHRKPDREAFAFVAREMGVAPGSILFFDDALPNVEGARIAGMQAVHVRSNQDVLDALKPIIRP
ncbi:MAG: HAD family phosphatase [Alphaproteobacteria bacterium]|nr:HAD family phosphatase [Alphaproteobacteria bacterium]MBL6937842.1 HAD family phosphatase [Alphaproteobacteria bacterium]MBL7099332.1 HAD family phosphatase [Alphaproteobacteria bacterium]